MDIQKLIEDQTKRKEKLKILIDPKTIQTRQQFKDRIAELKRLGEDFQRDHNLILKYGKPDIPYIVCESGQALLDVITSTLTKWQQDPGFNPDPNLNISLGAFMDFDEGDQPSDVHSNRNPPPPQGPIHQNAIGAGQNQNDQMRKLNFRIQKLKFTLNSTRQEMSSSLTWTKELFESKNKFLVDQWKGISELEEDIMMSDNSIEPNINFTMEVYEQMNDVISQMAAKVQTPGQREMTTPRASRLPDLKVPTFDGDYRKWQNFRDVFETLIHNREDLSVVQKMEYLKTFIEGEPLRLISAYTLSADNYNDAYDVLLKRYANKRKLFSIHLNNMTKPIGKHASSEAVKELHDSISEGMTAIKNLGIDNSSWGPIIVHYAMSCLDTESRSLYETKYNEGSAEIPQLDEFLKFLEGRYKTLEILDPLTPNQPLKSKTANHVAEHKNSSCQKCEGEHKIFMCPKFIASSVKSRYRFIKTMGLCINCLNKHKDKSCESKRTCKHCNKLHNTLLHFEKNEKVKASVGSKSNQLDTNKEEVLATAKVLIRDCYGNPFPIRVLIDTGAQANFITESLVQRLRLKRIPYQTEITGIGKVEVPRVSHAVELTLEPAFPSTNFFNDLVALVMGKEVTSQTPLRTVEEKLPSSWPSLQLADHTFNKPGRIDMILGIAFFTKIILPEVHRSDTSGLIAMSSRLGWLIMGETVIKNRGYTSIKSMISVKEVQEDISKFWELEDIPLASVMSMDDKMCENSFRSTHKRYADGRYEVCIPFCDNIKEVTSDLQTSRARALCRFYNLEAKFKKNPEFAAAYKNFIQEYLSLGHMKKVESTMLNSGIYYMPHHAIIKPESTSTKLRVVFDASARTQNNISLNQLMRAGPRLQDDLASIVLRWRFFKFVLSGDIEKMYRQIQISPTHRKFQRIFWRNQPNEPMMEYELTTITYGTTSAPYLAIKTLQQLAKDEIQHFPVASQIVLRDFYVDDVLTGADTQEECIEIQQQLEGLMKSGGFLLKKWTSNCSNVLEKVNVSYINQEMLDLQHFENASIKTLGLVWKPRDDQFHFKVTNLDFSKVKRTKRALASDISKIFDPLGWLSPVTINAKILFQETWKLALEWDEELPDQIMKEWMSFRENLSDIEDIIIPRWLNTSRSSTIELHGFCDSSKVAYAAAMYIRVTTTSGTSFVSLLSSKTKVAPIKQELSIARMELCGALLLSKLYDYVIKTFNWEQIPFTAWCDSMIALAWIDKEPSKWNSFVANRVQQIQELTKGSNWRYVPTDDNPADCASRGISTKKLAKYSLWWNGPLWLNQKESAWPSVRPHHEEDVPEKRRMKIVLATANQNHSDDSIEVLTRRFSSYHKLKVCMSYCLRFIKNCRSKEKVFNCISAGEIREAELTVIRLIQRMHYAEDLANIRNKSRLNNKNGLLSLTPMLDNDEILRVTGRLENSALTFEEKHPIILPYRAHVSKLISEEAHKKCSHGSNNLTEYVIRRKFWIIKCSSLVKSTIFQCVQCRRSAPIMSSQLMGQLPSARVTLNNPFFNTGVDYAGPFTIRPWKGRCQKVWKSYISVFVCMATKAIHLELASDLSADTFIAAYRRFSFRRGPCRHIYSDCGTNFVGSNRILKKELKEFQRDWSSETQTLTAEGITWHFNPPSNPHAGGLWEAAVKSIKKLLVKHLGPTVLTYEEFYTLIVQLEGCLNSRPLGVQKNVPDDQAILTPNHFLLGTSNFSNPEPERTEVTLATRWKYVQRLKQQIFNDFKLQLLRDLQRRNKWNDVTENIQPGDVVLVEDPAMPPHKYPLALVKETHPGQDGLTRVVTVKMESGRLLKRPIVKVCPLPVLDKDNVVLDKQVNIPKKHNLRPRVKPVKVGLTTLILLSLLTLTLSSIPGKPYTTSTPQTTSEEFAQQSGFVFAKVGNMKSSLSSWTIIMFYNMSSFFVELNNLQDAAAMFQDKCSKSGPLSTYCSSAFVDIQQQLNEIIEDNEILMELNHIVEHPLQTDMKKRSVTSLLPFVGTLSRAAFGTLDEEYARDIERTISNMQYNDNNMMNLIKNQTSIMQTFLQQARLSEERSKTQLGWITSNLNTIEVAVNNIQAENTINTRLQFIAAHIGSRTQHLFSIQHAIIQAITNAHHGNPRAILHPAEFKRQLRIMKSSLPVDLVIPVSSNNIIGLYSLLTVKTRVSEKMIIFYFTLPLVASKRFEIFKVVPIPIRQADAVTILQPESEYIAINLHREKYIPISKSELERCSLLDGHTFLCHEKHPERKNIPAVNSCEFNIFVYHKLNADVCRAMSFKTDQLWIQLPVENRWIFYLKDPQAFTEVCAKTVRVIKLQGEGILTLQPSCTLEHTSFTIPSSQIFTSEIEEQVYFPVVNISWSGLKHTAVIENKTSVMIKVSDSFTEIEQSLSAIKHQQVLKSQESTHRVAIGSVITSGILSVLAVVCLIYGGYLKFRSCVPSTPKPKPRKSLLNKVRMSQLGRRDRPSTVEPIPSTSSSSEQAESHEHLPEHPLDAIRML